MDEKCNVTKNVKPFDKNFGSFNSMEKFSVDKSAGKCKRIKPGKFLSAPLIVFLPYTPMVGVSKT